MSKSRHPLPPSSSRLGRKGYFYSKEDIERHLRKKDNPVLAVVKGPGVHPTRDRALETVWLSLLIGAVIILGSIAWSQRRLEGEVLGVRETSRSVETTGETEPPEVEEDETQTRQTADVISQGIQNFGEGLEREFVHLRALVIREEENRR